MTPTDRVCTSNLVGKEVNKPMLVEDGNLPWHTEREHRCCDACSGVPPCGHGLNITSETSANRWDYTISGLVDDRAGCARAKR